MVVVVVVCNVTMEQLTVKCGETSNIDDNVPVDVDANAGGVANGLAVFAPLPFSDP